MANGDPWWRGPWYPEQQPQFVNPIRTPQTDLFMWQPTIITDGGPWARHDMPCPVCLDRKAIIDIATNVFYPCGKCASAGWTLKQSKPKSK